MSAASQSGSTFDVKAFLRSLTQRPGVYQMQDARSKIIYIGKAKNLKKRVSSYFGKKNVASKQQVMVSHVHSIDVTVTHTESEALLLESQMIKRHRPRYNICLRDDKSYPYIYVTTHQDFPRVGFHRGAKSKKGRYFGPYPGKPETAAEDISRTPMRGLSFQSSFPPVPAISDQAMYRPLRWVGQHRQLPPSG